MTEHALFHCVFAKQVWEVASVHTMLRTIQITNIMHGICDGNKILNLPPVGLSNPLFLWIYVAISSARNLKLFEGRTFSEAETINKAVMNAK